MLRCVIFTLEAMGAMEEVKQGSDMIIFGVLGRTSDILLGRDWRGKAGDRGLLESSR